LLIFARRPAPVQITWLGYLGTTGLKSMDFRFTDPYLEVPGCAEYFTESPLMLPRTYWCYEPLEEAPAARESAGSSHQVTFGSLSGSGCSAKPLRRNFSITAASCRSGRVMSVMMSTLPSSAMASPEPNSQSVSRRT